jgi:hypothetical protein
MSVLRAIEDFLRFVWGVVSNVWDDSPAFFLACVLFLFAAVAFLWMAAQPPNPQWSNVCIRKEIHMKVMPTTYYDAATGTTVTKNQQQPVEECVEREWRCLTPDPDLSCPPMQFRGEVYQ